MRSVIPDNIHTKLLEKAGEGLSSRELSGWLKTQGVNASHAAVARLLRDLRHGREEITKAVTADRLKSHVTADLDILAEVQEGLLDRFRELNRPDLLCETIGPVTPAMVVLKQLSAELRTVTEKKLALSGAVGDGPGDGGVRVWLPPETDDA